jgi:uncharacterized protein YkwD
MPLPAPTPAHAAVAAESAIVREINSVRASRGLPRLIPTPSLARVAARHTADMLRHDRVSHSASNGTHFNARMRRTLPFRAFGETLAWAENEQASPRAIVRLWLASPPHRLELLNRAFRRVGVGIGVGRMNGGRVVAVTADFATQH